MRAENLKPPGQRAAIPSPDGLVTTCTFPADFRWVRRVIQETAVALAGLGMPADVVGSVEIVLAEALNNVVEHAYPKGSSGPISLSVRQHRAGLMVEIRDSGRPMPKGSAPLGDHPLDNAAEGAMPEGGYGWYLIRELVRDLIYDRRNGENFLVFRMAVSAPG